MGAAFIPDFEVAHIGVNCGSEAAASDCADFFQRVFGLARNPAKESADSCYTGTTLEWVKKPGRGTHGHIAITTADLPAARAYLEERGFPFDDASAKFKPDGSILVIYGSREIAGFAIHLQQR